METVLVNPPLIRRSGLSLYYKFEHLGLCYLAAFLRAHGRGVTVIDSLAVEIDVDETVDRILSEQPAVVGFTLYRGSLPTTREIVARLRAEGLDAHVTAGGHFATFRYDDILAVPGIDSVIRGEGEHALLELVAAIRGGQAWRDIPNLAYATDDGAVAVNPLRSLIEDLDALPFPARDNFDEVLRIYSAAGFPISSSRGCFYNCSFCTISSFYDLAPGRKWRSRGASNVVDEIEAAGERWDLNYVHFHDDCFLGSSRESESVGLDIARELIRREIQVPFVILTRVDNVDMETFALLRDAGLWRVELGIESGVQRCLDTFNKGTTVEQNRHAIEVTTRLGIEPLLFFIMFDPFVTLEEVRENYAFMCDYGYEHFATPFIEIEAHRGTPIRRHLEARGLVDDEDGAYTVADPRAEYLRRTMGRTTARVNEFVGEIYDGVPLSPGGRTVYEMFAALGQAFLKEVFETTLAHLESAGGLDPEALVAFEAKLADMERRFETDAGYAASMRRHFSD